MTRRTCPGGGDTTPLRARHGFRCRACGSWWLGPLVRGLGHLPSHTVEVTP